MRFATQSFFPKSYLFRWIGLVIALAFWFAESLLHYLIFDDEPHGHVHYFEVIPTDSNELWMRLLIIFMVLNFGYLADIMIARRQRAEREKVDAVKATVRTLQDQINNHLQHAEYFCEIVKKKYGTDIDVENFNDACQKVKKAMRNMAQNNALEFEKTSSGTTFLKITHAKNE